MFNSETLEERPSQVEIESTQKYALVSVSDKQGIIELSKALERGGYRIISTRGTAKTLVDGNVEIIPIQEITGNPEAFDGRMKTISFQIESGIIFDRKNRSHVTQAQELKVPQIDVVVCNLYPFVQTIQKPDVTLSEAVENIDVGGPTMIRAAAKNFENVLVVVDPTDHQRISEAIDTNTVSFELRKELAVKAFCLLSDYDAQVAQYLSK